MTGPVKLVPAPTVEQEIRDNCIAILRAALADAEAGKVTGVIVLTKETDGLWGHRASATISVREDIGSLTMLIHDRIARTRG